MMIPDRDSPPEPEPMMAPLVEEPEPVAEEVAEPEPKSRAASEKKPKRRTSHDEAPGVEGGGEIRNHGGGTIHPRDDFFVSPPEEIGEVTSAYTSLRKDVNPMSPGARLTSAIIAGVVGLAIGLAIAFSIKNKALQVILPLGLATIGLLIVIFATGFRHSSTYVGKEGVARYKVSGNRDNITEEVFTFKDAAELRTTQTRHYTNNVYQGTNYNFTWTDLGGRVRFVITGTHRSEQGTPPAKDAYHFATAAERAWTFYLLDQVMTQLKMSGTVFFGLGGKNWVKLSERHITLHFNGETTECDADEMAEVRIDQGQVQVRRKDAREGWFSSTGVFKFPYGSLANAHLFLILMDKLVEVPIN
jgi:hypothetical protein